MYSQLNTEEKSLHEEYFLGKIREIAMKSNDSCNLTLPFFHTCNGHAFRSIFHTKEITPISCEIFKQELTYLFYGKPAYRLPSDGKTSRDNGRFPVTFILKLDNEVPVEQVFPFDTGALVSGYLKSTCGDARNPAQYGLGSTLSDVESFITCFYGTDNEYYYCSPVLKSEDIDPLSYELQRILSLIKERSYKEYDDRAYTVELQTSGPIDFDKGMVKAILLPSVLMGTAGLADYMYNNNIEAITYPLEQADPSHMTPLLQNLAKGYMEKEKII